MRVFISWAKDERSRVMATALHDWLPDLIQSLDPWTSTTDIGAGVRWSREMAEALSRAKIGILCVTPANQREPWLLFEAGALAKTLDNTFVCPYLIDMQPADLASGPLTQFQAKTATREGTFDLVSTINSALGPAALSKERLARLFEHCWPALETRLADLAPASGPAHKTPGEMMVEILETVRSLARRGHPHPASPDEHRSRLDHSHSVSQILDTLAHSGQLNAARSVRLRRELARLPPRDLESVHRLVHRSVLEGGTHDDAYHGVLSLVAPLEGEDANVDEAQPAAAGVPVKARRRKRA